MPRVFPRLTAAALSLSLFLCAAKASLADPLFKANDRVVFYGDSITEQRLYTKYIQQYMLARYPGLKLRFFNAGWSGDTAPGGLNRLDRDVLSLKPTVVTLFFGMNDGGYKAVDDATVARYRQGLEGIVKALQAKNVRVIVFSPGCVDPDRRPALGQANYNKTLETLDDTAKAVAQAANAPFVDVHWPMLAVQSAEKAKDPKFTMIPDAIHPNEGGHMVMANIMLRGLGAEPMPAYGEVTAKEKSARIEAPAAWPLVVNPASETVARDSGAYEFFGRKLTVHGLPAGSYDVLIDGTPAGTYKGDELGAGVFLNTAPGDARTANSPAWRAAQLFNLVDRKENLYYTAWREVRMPFLNTPQEAVAQQTAANMVTSVESLHDLIHALIPTAPKSVITVSSTVTGENLALNKPYTASDPNAYNWGIGGLTDGSWEMGSRNTFATGDKEPLAKDATIDLGDVKTIGAVRLGTPNFGGTKTITVSISTDGQTFKEVGTHIFANAQAERYTYQFTPAAARYVRLSYPDRYEDSPGYSKNFAFTTEAEVYGAQQ
jgi:lysophospholipase L1-like esterase